MDSDFTVKCGKDTRTISANTLSAIPAFLKLVKLPPNNTITLTTLSIEELDVILALIEKNVIPDPDYILAFDCAGLGIVDNYFLALAVETNMRQNFATRPADYQEPFYGLEQVTASRWSSIKFNHLLNPNILEYKKAHARSWKAARDCITDLDKYIVSPHLLIAGLSVYSYFVTCSDDDDIELYLHGCTPAKGERIIEQLITSLRRNTRVFHVERFTDSILIGKRLRVHLHLYQTPSDILHSFDVDAMGFGYDGSNIWMTHRCWYALHHRYNTVNTSLALPQYEKRLLQYAQRGMAIRVPNFDPKQVDYARLTSLAASRLHADSNWLSYNDGLDLLLLCKHYQEETAYITAQHTDSSYISILDLLRSILKTQPHDELFRTVGKLTTLLFELYVSITAETDTSIAWQQVSRILAILLQAEPDELPQSRLSNRLSKSSSSTSPKSASTTPPKRTPPREKPGVTIITASGSTAPHPNLADESFQQELNTILRVRNYTVQSLRRSAILYVNPLIYDILELVCIMKAELVGNVTWSTAIQKGNTEHWKHSLFYPECDKLHI
jgi:hypothetical protein